MLVIGIDSSTQSTKAQLIDADTGAVIASGSAPHPPTNPPVSEQDPAAWWEALAAAIEALGPQRKDAVALSVAGQQHGLVLIDEADEAIRPAKLWNDTTSAGQATAMVERAGASWWAEMLGVVPVAAFTITKLAWVAEHEPEAFARTRKIMLPHDYLTWRLSGEHVTDRGDASGSGWFDATTGATNTDAFTAAGLDPSLADLMPDVRGPADAAGTIRPDVASALGLSPALMVGPGTGDNMGAALGLGLAEGDAVMSLGTSGTVYRRTSTRANDPSGAVAGFCDATGGYLPLVCTLNATKVTDTVARWLGTDAPGLAKMAIDAGPAPIEPVLVPYFDGERTPNRPDARGMMVGLSTATTGAELARAAHDGVVCGLLDGLDALGSDAGRVLLVGGGARSVAYRRRLADIAGQPITIPDADEAVATGAGVQATVVADTSLSVDDVATRWSLGSGDVVEPDPDVDGALVRARYRDASAFDDGLCRPLNS